MSSDKRETVTSVMTDKEVQYSVKLQMHIDTLTIPVEENMTVQIVWSRGAKKVPTKKRMLQANAQTAHFGEKFAISTNMDLNPTTMKPTKQKLSKLQVLSNKPKGVIGTADLDLANYG